MSVNTCEKVKPRQKSEVCLHSPPHCGQPTHTACTRGTQQTVCIPIINTTLNWAQIQHLIVLSIPSCPFKIGGHAFLNICGLFLAIRGGFGPWSPFGFFLCGRLVWIDLGKGSFWLDLHRFGVSLFGSAPCLLIIFQKLFFWLVPALLDC